MKMNTLETPSLILDKCIVERNIRFYYDRLEGMGVSVRPHGKTAKSKDVMNLISPGNTYPITVSTLKEAEYYFEHGYSDIIYAVGIAPNKLERIASLIRKGCDVSVLLDSRQQVTFTSQKAIDYGITIPVLIELDCDGHRSGLTYDDPLLIETGRLIQNVHGLSLKGVLTHAGESYSCSSVTEIQVMAETERFAAVKSAEILKMNGFPCPVVSIGSTPTSRFTKDLTGITEVRTGVFMFHDLVMAGLGVCSLEEIGISVLASVIGHQKKRGWVMTDAGWMAMSRDRGTQNQTVDQGYGVVCDIQGKPYGELIVTGANQEHGIITNRHGHDINWDHFPIGGMVRILPNHACATAAKFDRFHVCEGTTEISYIWTRINGW